MLLLDWNHDHGKLKEENLTDAYCPLCIVEHPAGDTNVASLLEHACRRDGRYFAGNAISYTRATKTDAYIECSSGRLRRHEEQRKDEGTRASSNRPPFTRHR